MRRLDTTIYSNYVFTGHGGSIAFHIQDVSTATGSYTVKVYECGIWDTVIKSMTCQHGKTADFTFSSIDSEAVIFFAIVPDGTTYIEDSYLARNEE